MKPCSAPLCARPHHSRGYCRLHLRRLNSSGTLERLTPNPGEPLEFLRVASASVSDKCVLWPYGQKGSGYPAINLPTGSKGAHVVSCEMRHGDKPFPRAHAAHNCGNRLCVNGSHIRWATAKQNAADKKAQGTWNGGEKHGMAKLTNAQAAEAREMLSGGLRQVRVAEAFGVSRMTISLLARGRTYQEATK